MYFKTTYDEEFDDLLMHLKAKYPSKLFDLEGIGKQLDMSAFSKNFFASKVTSDASIDANANVDDISVIAYTTELPKPYFKLNSYYVLWKELKKLYGLQAANQIVEMQLTGDIYIHDFHGVGAGMPYSYSGDSVIIIKYEGKILYTTMEHFFKMFLERNDVKRLDNGSEEIELKIRDGVQVLDGDGKWVTVTRVLRHKSHSNLMQIETRNGKCTIVTKDHPVILENGEKKAEDLTTDDFLANSHTNLAPLFKEDEYFKIHPIPKSFAYICGQEANIDSDWYTLSEEILSYNKDAIYSEIAGIIDTYGHFDFSTGAYVLTSNSFAFIQQLSEIFKALNIGYTKTFFNRSEKKKKSLREFLHRKNSAFKDDGKYRQYGLMCYFTDKKLAQYSEKIQNNIEIAYGKHNISNEGNETNQIAYIHEVPTSEYVYDITTESGHFHCQGLLQHNCFNYSTYDILVNGLPMIKKVKSTPPKYLYAFKSQLEQFTIIASNSTLGATGLADMLIVMSYFVKNILETKSDAHFHFETEEDCWRYVRENLTSFIYTINQPMRANQSPFTNVSIYDDVFLNKLKEDYVFPDGTTPNLDIVRKLQSLYLDVMNEELRRTPLTFPVTTACFSVNADREIQDENFLKFIAKANQEFGFINIYCGDSSTLSSCCRLRSERDNEYFNSFGSGSSKIGSLGVCSINFPRLAIKYPNKEDFLTELAKMVEVSARVNNAKRHIVKKRIENGNEPLYSLGFMDITKQYSTTGVNGFNECIELLGSDILTEEGQQLALEILDVINNANQKFQKQYNAPHNCEQVPGENMSIKMADKDKLLGYQTQYDIYSNQFIPLTTNADMLDRIKLQGLFDSHFSGGAICHLNCDTKIDNVDDIAELIRISAKMGVVYFAINYVLSECENGHMSVSNDDVCPICGKPITNKYTRVVGFLTNIKNWHKTRREKDFPNRQFYKDVKVS